MTEQTTSAPARMRRQARVMKVINRPMRRVLGLPFPTPLSRRLMVVTHVGRRTGRVYHQPVSYVRDGETLLTPGGGRWTRNLADGEAVNLRVGGRRVVARPERVRDPEEVERLLRRMLAVNPRLASFVPFVGRDGTIDREKLTTAVGYGFCVVRWHLVGGAAW
jgi:deazaflavin-dependent oxidoreductase (nitroreductase family)